MRLPLLCTTFIILVATISESRCTIQIPFQRAFLLARKALDGRPNSFVPHVGNAPFTNWLGMNLDFSLIEPLLRALNTTINRPLQTRNESHITVVTPPEFDNVLSRVGITMEAINQVALKNSIQKSKVHALCLGRAAVKLDNLEHEAYQIIVKSRNLLKIRQDVFELYVSSGGEPSHFAPKNYYPHITVGYLHRDLFEQDGVFKGTNACWANLKLV